MVGDSAFLHDYYGIALTQVSDLMCDQYYCFSFSHCQYRIFIQLLRYFGIHCRYWVIQ